MLASMALLVSTALADDPALIHVTRHAKTGDWTTDECLTGRYRKIDAWFQMNALWCCDDKGRVFCSNKDAGLMCWCDDPLGAPEEVHSVSKKQGTIRGHFDYDDHGRLLFTNWTKNVNGWVCADHFNDNEARVICDEQGMGVQSWKPVALPNAKPRDFILDNLVCGDDVTKFDDCNYLLNVNTKNKARMRGKLDVNGLGPDVAHLGNAWLQHRCESQAGIMLVCAEEALGTARMAIEADTPVEAAQGADNDVKAAEAPKGADTAVEAGEAPKSADNAVKADEAPATSADNAVKAAEAPAKSADNAVEATEPALKKEEPEKPKEEPEKPKEEPEEPKSEKKFNKKKFIIFIVGFVVQNLLTMLVCGYCYRRRKARKEAEKGLNGGEYDTVATNAASNPTHVVVPPTHEAEEEEAESEDSVELKIQHSSGVLNIV